MKTSVIPAILQHTEENIRAYVQKALLFSNTIHIDVIDETFSVNTTLPNPAIFKDFTPHAFFEVHLMVKDPISFVKPFQEAGFNRFLGHVEYMTDKLKFLYTVTSLGKEAFLALDLETSASEIMPEYVSYGLNGVTIMTVKAGKSGQVFEEKAIDKIKNVRSTFPLLDIEVDGGINESNIVSCRKAGANIFAATSTIFKANNPALAVKKLAEKVQNN